MKAILKYIPLLLIGIVSCKKVENRVFFEGGTAPQITATNTAVRLEPGEETNFAIRFNWTNPNYNFNTGLSSQDVNYMLEIDTVGGNFKSSIKFSTIVAKALSLTYTVDELNKILGNTMLLQLNPRRSYNLEARVTSSIGSAVPLVSTNKVTFSARPFPPPPKVPVPTAGTLWIVGNAVASGWSNPSPWSAPFVTTQKFTKLNDTQYELTIPMIPGGGYKLIQTEGDWGSQYSFKSGNALGGEFEKRDATQFDAPSATGTYKLSFNFQVGTFVLEKQ
jgi:starch-binding outer membrane protein SusE/F